jgi:hypothetical protein
MIAAAPEAGVDGAAGRSCQYATQAAITRSRKTESTGPRRPCSRRGVFISHPIGEARHSTNNRRKADHSCSQGKPRGAKHMTQNSSDVLNAIYMPDCRSESGTPIAGENTASATMQVVTRRMAGRFATSDRLVVEPKRQAVIELSAFVSIWNRICHSIKNLCSALASTRKARGERRQRLATRLNPISVSVRRYASAMARFPFWRM